MRGAVWPALWMVAAALRERLSVHDGHGALVVHAEWRAEQTVEMRGGVLRLGALPRGLAEVVLGVQAEEGWAVASLTRGTWREERWGAVPCDARGIYSAALGSELVVGANCGAAYGALARGVGGVLAASFSPDPVDENMDGQALLRGSLPEEALCSENVHALLDGLPCGRRAGAAALLAPAERLMDTTFHALVVDVQWTGADKRTVSLAVHLVAVADHRRRGWALEAAAAHLLHEGAWRACAAANGAPLVTCGPGVCAAVRQALAHDASSNMRRTAPAPPRGVSVARALVGPSRDVRTMALDWLNTRSTAVSVEHTEALPWGVAVPRLRTATNDGGAVEISVARRGPHLVLRFRAVVAPGARVGLRLALAVRMVPVWRLPAAQQRGFVIPPGSTVVAVLGGPEGPSPSWRLATGVGAVTPVVPDSSMPYNAMMISATAMALLFGAVFNASFRRFAADGGRSARLRRAVQRVRSLLARRAEAK